MLVCPWLVGVEDSCVTFLIIAYARLLGLPDASRANVRNALPRSAVTLVTNSVINCMDYCAGYGD